MPQQFEVTPAAPARVPSAAGWVASALFAALIAAVTAHHEMWRDEVNVWLFARDTSSPLELLWAMIDTIHHAYKDE